MTISSGLVLLVLVLLALALLALALLALALLALALLALALLAAVPPRESPASSVIIAPTITHSERNAASNCQGDWREP